MNIKSIKKLKNNKYSIVIDDIKIVTFDNVILENNLLYKVKIDEELYNKILDQTAYYEIYNKIVKYVLKRRRSESEVKKYLLKYNLKENDNQRIINKLKEINLINDKEYCKAFINDSICLGKCGISKIKQQLLDQNISTEFIEDSFNYIDVEVFDKKLEKLIIKKIKLNKKYSNNFLKQKILNEMLSLGYNKDKILTIIEKNMTYNNIIIEKEFDKLYIKLSKKYDREDIIKNIRQKLLSKGFCFDDVNEIIIKKTEEF